ncbi:MAG: DUF1987 domain-containing protein [Flavobacteriales bacterium]|nr:DUF1987 domain-containing protein [Flavobacteriales bacterium]
MKVIDLPLKQDAKKAKVEGAFTFLSAGELIYQLETALELVESSRIFEMTSISFHVSFLDVRCKKILFNYMGQIEALLKSDLTKEVIIEWRYDWFDDDMIEMGELLNKFFELNFHQIETDRLYAM